MKARSVVLTLAVCLVGLTFSFAANPIMGTWKLNEAKSKFAAGATKNHTVMYEAAGDQIKVTVDGTDAKGNAVHSEWTGKLDGKDYPLTGDSTSDMRSYKMINDHTLELTQKKDGKMVSSGKVVVSPDGKTRTVTTTGMDDSGKKMHNMAVYDKQ